MLAIVSVGVVLVVIGALAIRMRSSGDGTAPAIPTCAGDQTVRVDEQGPVIHRNESPSPTQRVIDVADWDPSMTWAFETRSGSPLQTRQQGLYRAAELVDITFTNPLATPHPYREREVILGRDVWQEGSQTNERKHCRLQDDRVVSSPLRVFTISDAPPAAPGAGPAPQGVHVNLTGGDRLAVTEGPPTTIDGKAATTYVWIPSDGPWMRAELTLDERSQLRKAIVRDTARDRVLTTFSADPTDARIVDPSDQPIVTAP